MNTRVREKQLIIRTTDYEYEVIMNNIVASGCKSLQEYALKMLMNGFLVEVNTEGLDKLAYEINKIGVNINQIAHVANSDNCVSKESLMELKDDYSKIKKLLKVITNKYDRYIG